MIIDISVTEVTLIRDIVQNYLFNLKFAATKVYTYSDLRKIRR
jgi:hypothetical protein